MNVQKIIDALKKDDTITRLYFTRKRGIKYFSYSPSISQGLQKEIKKLIIDHLNFFTDVEQIEFSPLGYRENTIETYTIDEIENYDDVIESYEQKYVEDDITDDIINKLNFYCLVLEFEENEEKKEIKFFRRVTKFKKLSAREIMGKIQGNSFEKLNASLLGIDGDVDIIIEENNVLVLNHVALERIFSISDHYQEKAQRAIDFIRNADRIINFDKFEEDAVNDGRITRTLTKMLKEENRLSRCFEHFENIINVIEIFELEIDIQNVNGVDMIVYEDKNQLMDIIRLVRDSYYKSIINDRPGIDDAL